MLNFCIGNNIENQQIIQLRNPVLKIANWYVYDTDKKLFFELLEYAEPMRTWLNNDRILWSGSVFLKTPIDPLFLMMYYIQINAAKQYVPLEDILFDGDFPKITLLQHAVSEDQLKFVCVRH